MKDIYIKFFIILISQGLINCTPSLQHHSLPGQFPDSFETEIKKTTKLNYLIYIPDDYLSSDDKWPLLLFLHGSGESGDSLLKVKVHGPPKLIDQGLNFPFIVVSPQCPENSWWSDSWQIEVLNKFIDMLLAEYKIDKKRIYVTGLSMGGFGTWALAIKYPNRFAAIAPISSGWIADDAKKISHLPIWAFHGDKDLAIDLKKDEEIVNALDKIGGNIKFTIYHGHGHDIWNKVYNDPKLYEWFLKHTLK